GQVVNLCNISTSPLDKYHWQSSMTCCAPDRTFHRPDPVGGDPAGIGRSVAGKIDDHPQEATIHIPYPYGPYVRIDRPRIIYDVRIAHPRMGIGQAIFHSEPAVKGNLVLVSYAHGQLRIGSVLVGPDHCTNNLIGQMLDIPR